MPEADPRILHIGGSHRASVSGQTFDVISPVTEVPWARAARAVPADVDDAVRAGRQAFDGGAWSGADLDRRGELLRAACDVAEQHIDEIAAIQAREIGMTLRYAKASAMAGLAGVRRLTDLVRKLPTPDRRVGGWEAVVFHQPVGVAAIIPPWSGPFAMSCLKSGTALLAGCTVVEKPSIDTPFSSMVWAEALYEVGLPEGAYNLIPGGSEIGAALVGHREVDFVSFTGGVRAGRLIAATCGEQLKRSVLELGGKSAAVVYEDADIDNVVTSVAAGIFPNCGQVCSGFTRVIVPAELHDAIAGGLAEIAKKVVVGDPLDGATTMGPLASQRQFERVKEYFKIAESEGQHTWFGGHTAAGFQRGYFVEPTIYGGVKNSSRVAQEEIFGPVVCVIPYGTGTDPVAIANASEYGLHAGVFTSDGQRALDAATRLRTGSVTFNGFTTNVDAPRDGIKDSGLGVGGGLEGFEAHRVLKSVNIAPAAGAYSPAGLLAR